MTQFCCICDVRVSEHSDNTWKEVRGFVGGPHKDSMTARSNTGRFAHEQCVRKLSKRFSQPSPDQQELEF
jgi:hypothetical protein